MLSAITTTTTQQARRRREQEGKIAEGALSSGVLNSLGCLLNPAYEALRRGEDLRHPERNLSLYSRLQRLVGLSPSSEALSPAELAALEAEVRALPADLDAAKRETCLQATRLIRDSIPTDAMGREILAHPTPLVALLAQVPALHAQLDQYARLAEAPTRRRELARYQRQAGRTR